MADRYWIAGSSANWNDTANWSTSSGGAGGASVPGSSDTAIFDGNGLGNCSTSAASYTVGALDLRSGYTGSLNKGGNGFAVLGNCSVASGASIYVGTSDAFSVSGNLSNAGTISGSTVLRLAPSGTTQTLSNTGTLSCGIEVRTLDPYATRKLTLVSDLTISGAFTFQNAGAGSVFTLDTANYNVTLQGNVTFTQFTSDGGNLIWTKGTGTLTFSGTANQTVDLNNEPVEDIVIDKTAGTVTLSDHVTTDSLTLTDGALALAGYDMSITGNCTVAAGFSVTDTVGTSLLTIGGNLDINGASGNTVTWSGPDLDVTGTADADWCVASNSDASAGTAVTATNSTDSGGNTNWSFGAAGLDIAIAAYHYRHHMKASC